MLSTSQRRLKPIQEHIDSGNWKQALQLCDKYQKKGEKSDAFLTTRALVLANQPEQALQKQGKDALLQLCNQSPPITDEDTISLLDNALSNLNIRESNSIRLWERAASAKPGDENLLEKWMFRAVAERNWISAQKAAMMLRKSFPKERHYEFWVVFMCYRIHKDAKNDDQTRKIFGTMAYKMLGKAASQTPVNNHDTAEVTPGKAIYTVEELYLLVSVYADLGYSQEALSVLQSDAFGVNSRLFKQDPIMFQQLFFMVLQQMQDYTEVTRICHSLMGLNAKTPDKSRSVGQNFWAENSNAWSILIQATINGDQPQAAMDLLPLLEAYHLDHSRSRHVAVAHLTLLQEMTSSNQDLGKRLLTACKDVYTTYYDKPFCIADIHNAVAGLDPQELEEFNDYVVQYTDDQTIRGPASLNSFAQSNRIELDYTFRISPSADPDLFRGLVYQSFSLSRDWIKSDTEPSASEIEILSIAVSSVIRLSNAGSQTSLGISPAYLIYAHLIVLFLVGRSPTTYTLVLLSTRLAQVLGLSSLALKGFQDLNVKSVQWDTFAYTALTRISTTHPHNTYSSRSSDGTHMAPQSALHSALVLYNRAEESTTHAIMQGLSHNHYRNTDQSIDFSEQLRDSICRKIYYVESQRVKRLSGFGDRSWTTYDATSSDNRDLSVFPNYEAPQMPTLEERLRLGPLPQTTWVQLMLTCDQAYQVLVEGPSSTSLTEGALSKIFESITEAQQTVKDSLHELTEQERIAASLQLDVGSTATIMLALRRGYDSLVRDGDVAKESLSRELMLGKMLENRLASIAPRLEAILQDGQERYRIKTDVPIIFAFNWEFFHWAYSILDALQFVKALLSFTETLIKIPSQPNASKSKSSQSPSSSNKKVEIPTLQRKQIKDLSTQVQDSIHDQVKDYKNRLSRQGALGDMLDAIMKFENSEDGGIAKKIEDMMGMAGLETAIGEMRDSWEEGLERVLSVKVFK